MDQPGEMETSAARRKERQLQLDTEKRYQEVIAKKKAVLKELYQLQARVVEIDEEIERIATAGPSALCHW